MRCLRSEDLSVRAMLRLSHDTACAGRLSLAHARKSLAGAQLQPTARLESLPLHSDRSAAAPELAMRMGRVHAAQRTCLILQQGLPWLALQR